jgi:hypothetical protein
MSEKLSDTSSKKTGGLLKLDPTTHNELITKTQNLQVRERSSNQSCMSRSTKNETENQTTEEKNPNAKMLFNPDNPDKPIYVANKRKPINHSSNKSNASSETTKDFSKEKAS